MARLSVSCIAWNPVDDDAAAALLHKHGFDSVDLVPGRVSPDLAGITRAQAIAFRDCWSRRGLTICGMQSLLFGPSAGYQLFDPESRGLLLEHLRLVARLANWIGAGLLVFGSPKNRDRRGLSEEAAFEIAAAFFRELGKHAEDEGVVFCFEPNASRYGCNFATTTRDAARLVREVKSPGVRLQLDLGTMILNGEDIDATIAEVADLVGYVHASEPDLLPISGRPEHQEFSSSVRKRLSGTSRCLEMRARDCSELERALATASGFYRARVCEAEDHC